MDDYPFVTETQDRHGTTRYRFRRAGKSLYLPKSPGHPEFEEAYTAAVEGRKPRQAVILIHPGRIIPGSFADGWRLVEKRARRDSLNPCFLRLSAPGLDTNFRAFARIVPVAFRLKEEDE